ncbi:Undecaprenyl phosphate-alpha-4-amino-4-deoxy-L-arabinose arabinosyl transferase [Rhizobiaceae bacterium]|nr:Undecaprenyl phosphate-alpha-4-amino-4-deoxy-L-arabinose arabinosyl transferase [Rhizobiaceae bacterium]
MSTTADAGGGRQGGALSRLHYLLLALFCVAAFVPGISSLPPTDRDESRFVQATKQMVETGDFVDIRFQDVPRYKKPAGIYWLQAAVVLASGDGADAPIWVYRTVSVAGALVSVLTAAWLGARMFGSSAGLVAGFGMAGILMLGFEARIAKTDAALLATALIAQAALAAVYLGHRQGVASPRAPWVFWAAQGAAILIKGPVIPALSLATVVAIAFLDRDRGWLRRLKAGRGAVLALLIAAPWLAVITWKSGAEFWQEAIGRDFLGKVASGQESHGFPPGYYFILYSATFWPFGIPAIAAGLAALPRLKSDPRLLFCLAWYLPYWIAIELMPTKLPHYILPAYPALVMLMAWATTEAMPVLSGWRMWLTRATVLGAAVVTIGLAAVAVGATPYLLGTVSWWGLLAALLLLLAGWLGSGIRPPLVEPARTGLAAAAAAAALGVLSSAVVPALTPVWLSPQIAEVFAAKKPCPRSRLVAAGYHEPSLVFLAGTDTLLTDGAAAAAELEKDACTVALVTDDQLEAFDAGLADGVSGVVEIGRIEGVNYSKGAQRTLTLFARAP